MIKVSTFSVWRYFTRVSMMHSATRLYGPGKKENLLNFFLYAQGIIYADYHLGP